MDPSVVEGACRLVLCFLVVSSYMSPITRDSFSSSDIVHGPQPPWPCPGSPRRSCLSTNSLRPAVRGPRPLSLWTTPAPGSACRAAGHWSAGEPGMEVCKRSLVSLPVRAWGRRFGSA